MGKREDFSRLQECYKQKFSEGHKDRIREITKNLNDQEFERMVDSLIDTSRFLPLPQAFRDAARVMGINYHDRRSNGPEGCGRCSGGLLDAKLKKPNCSTLSQDVHRLFCTAERCNYPRTIFRCPCQFGLALPSDIAIFYEDKFGDIWRVKN